MCYETEVAFIKIFKKLNHDKSRFPCCPGHRHACITILPSVANLALAHVQSPESHEKRLTGSESLTFADVRYRHGWLNSPENERKTYIFRSSLILLSQIYSLKWYLILR